ncbi:MAG: hypothetical protein SFV81_09385 [Pirellulaceae bacterium]|nr:hypothetical protein [Pirellulaceae bacterium]
MVSCLALAQSNALAGLVPSEVVLVVNGSSMDSRTLANFYISLRNIPAANVVVLDKVPNSEVISVDEFRSRILIPLLAELDRRKISNHIQCITYSCDFPTAIDITNDIKPLGKLPIYFTARASINALTYFYQLVQASNPLYIQLQANSYARREMGAFFNNPLGSLTEEDWNEIEKHIAANEHKEAGEALAKLADKYKDHYPISYLAAAELAQAGEQTQAIKFLERAIASGWTAGGYLQADERFANCRDNSDFQILQLTLDETQTKYQPTIGFEAKLAWGTNGVGSTNLQLGSRYLLSTVLGVTRGAGTTLRQAMDILERSASADFTQPSGGFYFCLTSDVRTTTRKPGFADAIETLQSLGFNAEIVQGTLPQGKKDVLGAMVGTPNFDWKSSGSELLPGSIAENLTSVGADMSSLRGQTKLTEFLKAGAAGSSGTVTEPYSMQAKFPHPQLYVHYARGLSLAEAFYASVTGPYQLLIIGDPLCQPFAAPPKPEVSSELRKLADNENLKFPLKYNAEAVAGKRAPVAPLAVSILFGGTANRIGVVQPNLEIRLNNAPAGYHEIRLISIGDDALGQRSEIPLPIWIGDEDAVSIEAPDQVQFRQRKATVTAKAQVAKSLTIWHESEQLAVVSSNEGEFAIPLESLGIGKVRLQARAELENGSILKSLPIEMEITP